LTKSLGARLLAAALLFIAVALVLVWYVLAGLFESYVTDGYKREMQAVSDTLVSGLAFDHSELKLKRQPIDQRFRIPAGGRYWQVSGADPALIRSRSLWDTELKTGVAAAGQPLLGEVKGPSGADLIVLIQGVTLTDIAPAAPRKVTIIVGADKSELDTSLMGFRQEMLKMLGLTGAFLALASALQIFVGLRPLINVRNAVAAVGQGSASRIADKGPVEVRPLITEINTLLDNERAAVERARARASDLAHSLKTPLTVLGHIGETLDQLGNQALASQLSQQVTLIRQRTDRQLALARTGTRLASSFDLKEMTDRVLATLKPIAQRKMLTCENSVPDGLLINADGTDFMEALGNLLDNALAHAVERIVVTGIGKDDAIRVTIEDDGLGISEPDRARALERGQRLDESSDGTGLGLAISTDIIRAYGGSISLSASDMGGLAVHMDWPISRKREP
jgi:signal transduction histidine kinase